MTPLASVSDALLNRLASVVSNAATNFGGGNRLAAMRAARRGIEVVPFDEFDRPSFFTRTGLPMRPRVTQMLARGDLGAAYHSTGRFGGGGDIGTVYYPEGRRDLLRHELNHGYWDAAQKDPSIRESMPYFMRWMSDRIDGMDDPQAIERAKAIRSMLNEVAAQMKDGTKFTDINAGSYVNFYEDEARKEAFRLLQRIQQQSRDAAYAGMVGGGAFSTGLAAGAVPILMSGEEEL